MKRLFMRGYFSFFFLHTPMQDIDQLPICVPLYIYNMCRFPHSLHLQFSMDIFRDVFRRVRTQFFVRFGVCPHTNID